MLVLSLMPWTSSEATSQSARTGATHTTVCRIYSKNRNAREYRQQRPAAILPLMRLRGGRSWDEDAALPCPPTDGATDGAGHWSHLSCEDADGDALTLFLFQAATSRDRGGAARQVLLEIDHEYSDGGFAVCAGKRSAGAAADQSPQSNVSAPSTQMPKIFVIGNDNILKPHTEGIASGEAARELWNGARTGSSLQMLQQAQIGDWSVSRLAALNSSSSTLQICNKFFASSLLFGADGTVVWLSNPIANKSLVRGHVHAHTCVHALMITHTHIDTLHAGD